MSLLLSENELGSQDADEFTALLEEYIALRPRCFMEIGSMYGWSLQHFIHYAEDGSTAVAVDLPMGPGDWRYSTQHFNWLNVWPEWAAAKNCDLLLIPENSHHESTLRKVEGHLGRQLDFLFIDGDHQYASIKEDYEMYSPLVREGGMIALHDIAEAENGGGHQFWIEVRESHAHREILKDPERKKGIGLLYL